MSVAVAAERRKYWGGRKACAGMGEKRERVNLIRRGGSRVQPPKNLRKILVKILHFEEFNVFLSVGQKYQCVHYDFSLLQSHTAMNVTTCHAVLTPTYLYFTTKT